ncbi:MAG: LacI family DNA-binding transcriptional regulator [Candidatus Limivicinus sp.]|jgi:DNA-binding LacI/PurR family transcriptional regulator
MSGITAKELAQKLGISAASVSVALNGKPGVSPATRQRILEAAAQAGYSTFKTAPAAGKSLCFLMYIDPEIGIVQETTFYSFVLKGIESAAKELGYRVLIRYYYADQDFDAQMYDIINDISGLLILGTEMTASSPNRLKDLICEAGLPFPVVIIDNFIFSAYTDCVGNDSMYGVKSAISYLIDRGHRRFGYLRSKQRITNFDDRENGIRMALTEHLGSSGAPLEVINVDISADRAYQDICSWLDTKTALPDAIFAENDVLAAAAIRAFNIRGVLVPEDVSVMGFDDIQICEMVVPTITTVHSFKEKLGIQAVGLLHNRIKNGETIREARASGIIKLSMSTRIVERGSVADKKR